MYGIRSGIAKICVLALCGACATAPVTPSGSVEMRLLPGQSPVADIDGPYAAYSRVGHGVILRVWPDSVADGAVDLSIIVRNTDLETVHLSFADVVAKGETGPLEVRGKKAMLARFDAEPDRRQRPPATFGSLATFGGGSTYDGNASNGVVKVTPPTSTYSVSSGSDPDDRENNASPRQDRQARRAQVAAWYLGSMQIEAGETAVGGISITLPETSQAIIVNVDVDSEDHEFTLVFERKP
jgi:hypothetical protein